MEIQKAIELIEKSARMGILLSPSPTLDVLASAEILCRFLEERGKTSGFLNPPPPQALGGKNFFKKISEPAPLPKEFIISVDVSKGPVSQLRYEKNENNIDVIFSPKNSRLHKDLVSFKEGKIQCDCVIALGVEDLESINGHEDLGPGFFVETPVLNIDFSLDNKKYGETNLVGNNKASISEMIYDLVSSISQSPLDKESATLLLAGIIDQTDSFKTSHTTADTLLTASELMRLGADNAQALSITKEIKPLNLIQLFGRASVRSKQDPGQKVLWSFLTSDDYEKTGRTPQDNTEVIKSIEKTFPPQDASVLLWQHPQEKTVHALLSGKRELLEDLQARGEGSFQSPHLSLSANFETFKEAEEFLSALLRGVL